MEEQIIKKEEMQTVDQVLKTLGGFWIFQWQMICCLSFLSIPYSASIFLMIFHAHNPSWTCAENSTICLSNATFESTDSARCNLSRADWQYDVPPEYSIVAEFDLICDRAYLKQLLNSIVFVGWGIGALILGYAGDNFGRKRVLYPSITMIILISTVASFLKSVTLLILCRFIVGLFVPGVLVQHFVLVSEYVDTNHRHLSTLLLFSLGTVKIFIILLKAYFIKQWRMLTLVCAAPYVIALLTFFYVPESIRWMRIKGHTKQLQDTLKRVAFWNRKEFPVDLQIEPIDRSFYTQKSSLIDIFRTRRFAVISCVLGYTWMANGMIYYAFYFAAGNLGSSIYISLILMNILGLFGDGINAYLCKRIGRKGTSIAGMFFASISCFLIAFLINSTGYEKVACGVAGIFFIGISFSAIYIWVVEIYPTAMRTNGMGFLQLCARIGAASAPWIANGLRNVHKGAPFIVMGVVSIVGAILLIWVPETKEQQMVDVPEEKEEKVIQNENENDFLT